MRPNAVHFSACMYTLRSYATLDLSVRAILEDFVLFSNNDMS